MTINITVIITDIRTFIPIITTFKYFPKINSLSQIQLKSQKLIKSNSLSHLRHRHSKNSICSHNYSQNQCHSLSHNQVHCEIYIILPQSKLELLPLIHRHLQPHLQLQSLTIHIQSHLQSLTKCHSHRLIWCHNKIHHSDSDKQAGKMTETFVKTLTQTSIKTPNETEKRHRLSDCKT